MDIYLDSIQGINRFARNKRNTPPKINKNSSTPQNGGSAGKGFVGEGWKESLVRDICCIILCNCILVFSQLGNHRYMVTAIAKE